MRRVQRSDMGISGSGGWPISSRTTWVPHLRGGLIVAKVGYIRGSENPNTR
jgi:hypothetical protein